MTITTPVKSLQTRSQRLHDLYGELKANPGLEHLRYMTHFVPGLGSTRPKVLFVADLPTEQEARSGQAIVGPERKTLIDFLNASGLKSEHIFYTNVMKYRPGTLRDPRPAEEMIFLPALWREIDILKPKAIVLLGRYASAVFFDGYEFGEVLGVPTEDDNGIKYLCTYSLGMIGYNPTYKQPLMEHAATLATIV